MARQLSHPDGAPHFYQAYGLEIASPVPLPELVPGGTGSDVVIRFASVTDRPGRDAYSELFGDRIVVRYADIGTFAMRGGREVWVDAHPGAREAEIRLILTGPVLGLLLHQRRVLVLHASTIDVSGAAVGFMGFAGAGKSTTAAALHAHGYPLLSDDLLPIDLGDGLPMARSGFPQLKLWPEALVAVGGTPEDLPRLRSAREKRARRANGFQRASLPLKRLYVLENGERLALEPVSGAQRVIELIRNAYASYVPELMVESWPFEQCSAVAERVAVRRLRRPARLGGLPDLVRLVEADLSQEAD